MTTLTTTPPAPAAGPDRGVPAGTTRLVAVLASAGIVVSLMQSIVIPLVPELPTLLHSSTADTSWAITVTLLAAAVATPTVGRLGDMVGKRRMLVLSLLLLVAGSVVAALASSLLPLIVGRALQGLAAGVVPLGISIMRDVLPEDRLPGATAMMSSSLGVGGALGLPLAALVGQSFSWHVLFWGAGALGVVALVLVLAFVPESDQRSGGRFDVLGAVGISVTLVCLLLAVSKGSTWGWGTALTLGLLAVAVLVLAAWVWWELRCPQPLVDLRVAARRQVLLTNVASAVFGFAMFAQSLVFPQLLQLPTSTGFGLGQPMLVVGLVMAPSGLVMMAVSPLSARITSAAGPKISLVVGSLVVAVGYLLGILLMSAAWQLVVVSSVIGAGIGLAYGAMPALVMGAVPRTETAAANSLNTLMRSIGTAVSSAVAGVVLAQLTVEVAGTAVPSQDGLRLVLAVAAGASLVACAVATCLPRRRASSGDA
ncbi:MAG TPA: MFS transporter [Cellulomonas sp.]